MTLNDPVGADRCGGPNARRGGPDDRAAGAGSRALALGALLALFAFYGMWILRTGFSAAGELYFTLVDDAMISMVYARNLAEGHGLVWSSGEAIEGFSNFLWTLIMALLHRIEPSEPRVALMVMLAGALVLLLHAGAAYRLAAMLCPGCRVAPAAAGAVAGLYFPVVFWTLRGLEVGFMCLLAIAATILTLELIEGFDRRRALALALLLAALLWTRLDAAVTAAVLIGGLALQGAVRDRWRSIAVVGGGVLASIAAITAFRLAYFGQALPNTYHLKLTGASLVERVSLGLRSFQGQALADLWFPCLIVLAGLLAFPELRERRVLILLAVFASQCLYSIYTGGDFAEDHVGGANRFIAQGVPCLLIVCVSVIERALRTWRPPGGFAILLAPALAAVVLLPISAGEYRDWYRHGAPLLPSDVWRARLGLLIRDSTAPSATVACHAAGNIVYFSRRRAVDLLGKSDRHVARGAPAGPFRPGHNKWDYRYSILDLEPDVVADDWGYIALFMARQAPDYERLANGVWVRGASRSVDRTRLSRPFR